jgi:hypothetical protein
MNAQEFFELTKKTRAAQKTFFHRQRPSDLNEAKRLERLLDAAIQEGLDPEGLVVKQLELLNEKEGE